MAAKERLAMATLDRTRLTPDDHAGTDAAAHPALASVAEALGRMRYGAIQLIVHDGRLVQMEVTERQRFT
jgi:hypothetical protein